MHPIARRRHRLVNLLQSLMLLAAMAALLGALGWVLAGGAGVIMALAAGAVLVAINPGLSPRLLLGTYATRPIGPGQAPDLYALLSSLARRAGLPAVPELHYVPSQVLNAFAVGSRADSAIAVSDGLLRRMSPRELAGILAHEVSHLRHNDTWVMGLADLFSRMTSLFSAFGQVLLLVNLPLIAFSGVSLSWTVIVILVLAPTVSMLMQLALSRTREYDADLGAVELTGDPRGLALALEKMEHFQGRVMEQILFPGRRVPDPSLLRTHPPMEKRIRRLLELEPHPPAATDRPRSLSPLPPTAYPAVSRRPRWHVNGTWY